MSVLNKLVLVFDVLFIAFIIAEGADSSTTNNWLTDQEDSVTNDETQLIEQLLIKYHPNVAPNKNSPVDVRMGFWLRYFDFIDEQEQLVLANGGSYRTWFDSRLTWNETAYNGTRRVLLNRDEIWTPDVHVSNSAKATEMVDTKAMVYSDGRVRMYVSYQLEFVCDMDLTYFPYDTQQCDIRFNSFHYTTRDMNLTNGDVWGISRIKSAKDFNIKNFTVIREVYYPSYLAPYGRTYVTYTISLTRASGAYSAKLVLPAVLTGFLILATFLLPSYSHEKITLSAIIFLCLLVLMVFYHMAVPSTGETILGQYLAFALCVDFFAIIMAVVSYNLKVAGNSSAPKNQFDHMLMNGDGGAGDEEESPVPKTQLPLNPRMAWLRRNVDVISFAVFSIVFIIGLAVILGRR